MLLRDVDTRGYARALSDVATPDWTAATRLASTDQPGSAGPRIGEYFSHVLSSPFGGPAASLRLPVEETPDPPRADPKTWAMADAFGADPTGEADASAAIQKAVDSGAETLFLPGHYALGRPVILRGNVRHVLGLGGQIDYRQQAARAFRIEGDGGAVTFEHLAKIGSGIENATDRPVILRSVGTQLISRGKGTIFLEDVAGDAFAVRDQRVFARQFNIENEGTHLRNGGGRVWVLGLKTERGGTLVETLRGGQTEIFGTFSYTTTVGKLAPMFVTENASVFAFFDEVCFSGDPFKTLLRETRGAQTKTILRGEGHTTPYISQPPE